MITQTVEYALRAMVYLAYNQGRPHTAQSIADATKVPPRYMSKVLLGLCKADLLESQRGPHGGFVLSRNVDEVSMLDVINAIEPIRRITECPLGIKDHMELCPLHRRLDEAIAHVEAAFAEATLASVLAEPTRSKPLCEVTLSVKAGV